MNTKAQIVQSFMTKLRLVDTSTRFSAEEITDFINRAYTLTAKAFGHKGREKAKHTETVAYQYWYDQPAEMPVGGINRITVGGVEYKRRAFQEFLDYKESISASNDDKYFALYENKFFLHPAPQEDGVEVIVWGDIQPLSLSADTDTTIFSYSDPELNEAILQKSLFLADGAGEYETNYKQIIEDYKKETSKNNAQDQFIDSTMFDVPDYFSESGTAQSNTGRFTGW